MRGVVVLVVHARAQQVGAEHLTALGLGAKAVGARQRALVGQVGAALLLIAIANAIETCQVGERLGRADNVVGGDGGVQVRQVDLDQLGTLVLQLLSGTLNSGLDLGRQALGLHKRRDDAHALALDAVVEVLGKVDGTILTGAVVRIVARAGKRVHGQRDILDRAAKGPHLVERRAKGNHAVTAHGAIRGLKAHHAAEARRLADGTAGVRAQRERDLARSDGSSRAARRAAGHALGIPRVIGTVEGRALGGAAKGKLVHVGLAHGQAAGVEHALDAGGGVDALVVLEHAGSASGTRAHEVHVVLNGQRHARERGQRLAGGTVGIQARSGLERELGRHLQECLDPALARLDGGKGGLGHLGSGKVAGGNARGNLRGGKGIEVLRHYSLSPSPKMDGTRK